MASDTTGWDLKPGETILRKVLHERFGGRRQGGIGPSSLTMNVFVFSDPASGAPHGYVDGWQDDGCFHYTGEGQHGDQRMVSGNAAVLHHRRNGKAIRVFKGSGGPVTYIDEFVVDVDNPFYTTDAPEAAGAAVRKVIVFRLRPSSTPPAAPTSVFRLAADTVVDLVAVEEQWTERAYVDPERAPYEAERREARLVCDFRDYLVSCGLEVSRLRIVPAGEVKPIFSDLYVPSNRLLVEAKGSVERGCIRMAIGQLFDYRRAVLNADCALLLPEKPREDLLALVHAVGVAIYVPDGGGFARLDPKNGSRSRESP